MKRQLSIGIYPNLFTEVLGGTERLCHGLVCYLAEQGHRVVLFCNNAVSEKLVLPVPKEVEIQFVTIRNPSNAQMQTAKKMLIAAKLDVFLAFNSSCQQLFLTTALIGTGIPYIYSELVEPAYVEKFWSSAGRKAVMSGADRIHMLRPPQDRDIPPHLRERVRVIPSPAPEQTGSLQADPRGKLLLSLGGQNANKQVPLLIKAFERLYEQFPDWKCEIWGVGPESRRNNALVEQSPAKGQLVYGGFADDALNTLARGSIYCIPSRFEGMPLTLLEAMSLGLPAVGFRQCAGVASLIQQNTTGLLAPEMTPESLASQLALLMASEELRMELGQHARQEVKQYSPERIHRQWEELLYETAGLRGHTQLDAFSSEPFASRARLSAAARREYLLRDFGRPMPGTVAFWRQKAGNILRTVKNLLHKQNESQELPQVTKLSPDLWAAYKKGRQAHAALVRSILHLRRDMIPEQGKSYQLPGECMASGRHHAMLARYFQAAQTMPSGGSICAIGAGLGWEAAILARTAQTVVCVEPDPSCARVAARFWPELRPNWHTDDILTFLQQTPDESFEGVVCIHGLSDFPPRTVSALFSEIARCLRRGGIVLCSLASPLEQTGGHASQDTPGQERIHSQNDLLKLADVFFTDQRFLDNNFFMGRKSL